MMLYLLLLFPYNANFILDSMPVKIIYQLRRWHIFLPPSHFLALSINSESFSRWAQYRKKLPFFQSLKLHRYKHDIRKQSNKKANTHFFFDFIEPFSSFSLFGEFNSNMYTYYLVENSEFVPNFSIEIAYFEKKMEFDVN